jgi:hypothetical protein
LGGGVTGSKVTGSSEKFFTTLKKLPYPPNQF